MKRCIVCNEEKSLEQFSSYLPKNKTERVVVNRCRECTSQYMKNYYEKNRDVLVEKSRKRDDILKPVRLKFREERQIKRDAEAPERRERQIKKHKEWLQKNKDRVRKANQLLEAARSEEDKKERRIRKEEYDKNYHQVNKEKRRRAAKTWTENNKERAESNNKRWKKENKDWIRERNRKANLKFQFGLSLEQYNEMLSEQKECCAICGRHQSEWKIPLCVDHDHTTNEIRGLLCRLCNTALGSFRDSPAVLRKAISYLEDNNSGRSP